MFELRETTQFKKDLKKVFKRSPKDFELVFKVLQILKTKGINGVPTQMKPHKLKGNYKNCQEFHIKLDLLIIIIQIDSQKEITLVGLGSHSYLFK